MAGNLRGQQAIKPTSHLIIVIRCLPILLGAFWIPSALADGKLLATSGINQFEGTGGGGLVPFATLSGYTTSDQSIGITASSSYVDLKDLNIFTTSAAINIKDRFEASFADQRLELDGTGISFRQRVIGLKAKVYGDLVYGSAPQVAIGGQYKALNQPALVPQAKDNRGFDAYMSVSRLHLAAVAGRNLLWNLTIRSTRANETGFLGFGGLNNDDHELMAEAAIALQLQRHFIVGVEYRQKPNNLSGVPEDDWKDIFIAWVPNKKISLVAAYLDAGPVGGLGQQTGIYFSINGILQ